MTWAAVSAVCRSSLVALGIKTSLAAKHFTTAAWTRPTVRTLSGELMNHVCDIYHSSACHACSREQEQALIQAEREEYDEMRDYEREQMWASF
jgi:hypothetical protein